MNRLNDQLIIFVEQAHKVIITDKDLLWCSIVLQPQDSCTEIPGKSEVGGEGNLKQDSVTRPEF